MGPVDDVSEMGHIAVVMAYRIPRAAALSSTHTGICAGRSRSRTRTKTSMLLTA
jgi:hypothetical protein